MTNKLTVPQHAMLELLYAYGTLSAGRMAELFAANGPAYMTPSTVDMALRQLRARKLLRCLHRDNTRDELSEFKLTRDGWKLIRDLV